MTDKQKKIIEFKIAQVKKALAADKRQWGGWYHDGGGYRYLQPGLYIQLQDYKGAERYYNWFTKNFPDDPGYPVFLFEWTLTLFKNNKLVKAQKKAFETFMSNTYLFDVFLGKELLDFDKWEGSNWENPETAYRLHYKSTDEALQDFARWLETFLKSETFYKAANKFIEIQQQLKILPVGRKRTALIKSESKLPDLFD